MTDFWAFKNHQVVMILTNFGQTKVLDVFQWLNWKYSKTKTKQIETQIWYQKDKKLVPLGESLKSNIKNWGTGSSGEKYQKYCIFQF